MEYGAVVVWWLLSVALGAAGLPIAATVLSGLPDRGAGFALPVALVVLVVPAYWIGHLSFGTIAVGVGVLVLLVGAAVTARRGPALPVGRFAESMAVFTAGFALLVAVRAVDPSVVAAGGEKFLDYGLLNSLLRSPRLPPQDMWFAGQPVKYYYGGHLIAAILTALSRTPAKLAYNLALAGFYGTLVSAGYGLAGSIATARGGPYRLAGAAGALFVGFASNLVPPVQVVLFALPEGVARWLAYLAAGAVPEITVEEWLSLSGGAQTPYYWIPSRAIDGTINEFPLFAFLNGDLHAHMMSTPFLLLVAGLAFAYYRAPAGAIRRRRAIVFGAIPPVAGLVAVVNTWSFPSTAGVTWLALVFAPADPADLVPSRVAERVDAHGVRGELGRVGTAALAAAAVALLGVLWALPFFTGPATGASGRSIGFFPARSGLAEFALVHGWPLLIYGLFLGGRAMPLVERRGQVALLAGVLVVVGLAADLAAVVLVGPLFAIAWILLRRGEGVGFEAVLFVAGAGLVLLVEFVYVKEQAGPGRMNTVFKTYMQVWVLWAVGAAAALVRLRSARTGSAASARRSRLARAFAAALVLSVSVYGAVALGGHFQVQGGPEPTLDATSAARASHPLEWEAIAFLDDLSDQPHIVTAPGCWCNPVRSTRPYAWVNAPSSFTGVPTLAGWSHEAGYRGRAVYRARVADVETIYTGPWADRVALLRRYDVRYVYVGPNERELYGDGVAAFEGRDGVNVAFRNDAVTIYAIDAAEL